MAIMEAQTSPSPPFSTEGLGPCQLSHSLDSYGHRWVFWSTCGNDEGGCGRPHHLSATADGAVIKDQIIRLLRLLTEIWCRCLVQFWGLVKIGDKTSLTTRDQPFALYCSCYFDGDVQKLCEYRKHCLDYLIPLDEDDDDDKIGPPGRVLLSGLPEYAWNVGDYTSREYPQRDYAVGRVKQYWALPIYHHPTRHLPSGVLEIVSPYEFSVLPQREVLEKLQNLSREVNLTTNCVSLLAKVNSCQDGEIAIIDEALSKVRQIRGLGYGGTEIWTTSGEILSSHGGVDFIRKRQGVVGRAFSSKSACFCRDIRQLSITEYPLVVQARSCVDSACFAVCLQSPCPKNCIYVLEFFLLMYEEDEDEDEADYGDPRTLLNGLMETLKECLGISFKIASGQELGQKLTVEVIKVSPQDEFDSFEICTTTSIGGEGMTKLQMAPFSAEGLGPCELSHSHSINNYYHQWVFWSTCGNDEGRCGNLHHPSATADGAVITDDIKCCLQLVVETLMRHDCLVQFWGLVTTGNKTYLTTCDQPFALQYNHFNGRDARKLCKYRKHCLKYSIPVDEDDDDHEIGPPGRVFRSGLPEYAWDLSEYTIREYPQRDYAVELLIRDFWVLPTYHPTRHLPIGVLEIVSTCAFHTPRRWVLEKLQNLPREVNLTITCVSLLAEVNSCQRGEIARIEEVLDKVSEICELDDEVPKTWTTSGEILSCYRGVDFIRKGQGVVGRAFSSKSACFCRDMRQLSITEYPLVVQARSCEHSACFAVCLQSSCPNKCIYVLEFFLPGNKKDHGVPRTLLRMLMETLKEHLQSSFKIASGQELGQKLTVEVIKVSPEDEFDSFEICSTAGIESQPRLEEVQGGDGMMQVDFSSQQVDAANVSMNGIHEQQNGSVGSTPRLAKAQGGEGMMQLDFSSQQVDTANAYINGIHAQHTGIVGSPPRPEHEQGIVNISYQESNLAEQKIVQPPTEDTHEHHQSGATRLEDDNGMWVKAEYQGRMIKFRLPFSARKINLEENVVQRLNLAMGSFIIEYQDEDDDRIWITCDGDLRTSMSTLSSLGRTTIKMYIVEDSPNRRDQ